METQRGVPLVRRLNENISYSPFGEGHFVEFASHDCLAKLNDAEVSDEDFRLMLDFAGLRNYPVSIPAGEKNLWHGLQFAEIHGGNQLAYRLRFTKYNGN